MTSFGIYLTGFVILIGALAYGAYALGVPTLWIGIGAAVLVGFALISGVTKTREKDDTAASD